jgi:hypothetical protein
LVEQDHTDERTKRNKPNEQAGGDLVYLVQLVWFEARNTPSEPANQRNETNQTNQMNQINKPRVQELEMVPIGWHTDLNAADGKKGLFGLFCLFG